MVTDTADQTLRALRESHRRLDEEIDAMRMSAVPDQLELARMKKRKLRLRDEIARAADAAVPDLIA